MDNNIADVILSKFKVLNNIEDETNDNIYKIYIEKAMQSICNLTNRNTFPEQLKYVVIDMLTDFYKTNIKINEDSEESNGKDFTKSISEAGRSVSFDNSSELEYSELLSANISKNLEMREKEIYRYRLLYKVTCNDRKN